MCLSMGCLDFLTVWRLSSKSKGPQRELSRSYIIIYGLGLEVNITLFSPWFKRREHRPHFLMGSVSKSQSKKSSWDGRYCNGHFGKYNQIHPACFFILFYSYFHVYMIPWFYFIFLKTFYFYFILLYNTVLVLPYIDMNPPSGIKLDLKALSEQRCSLLSSSKWVSTLL